MKRTILMGENVKTNTGNYNFELKKKNKGILVDLTPPPFSSSSMLGFPSEKNFFEFTSHATTLV